MNDIDFKKRNPDYQVLRAYREAIDNIRKQGRQPSPETLARYAQLKTKIKANSNGHIKK